MKIFDETENKYYELISYLLNENEEYRREEISDCMEKYLDGELDFEVVEALFDAREGSELVFYKDDEHIIPVIEGRCPIRFSTIEKQALKTLLTDEYRHHFLSNELLSKIEECVKNIEEEWNINDITIKNKFSNGVTGTQCDYSDAISIITKAIQYQKAIRYDNIRPGRVDIRDKKTFPVKIEFSIVNDRFRICAYEPEEHRFIKMNLDSLQNIKLCDDSISVDLQNEYKDYIQMNLKTVVLDVEPTKHAVERCFRVFSYYGRKAIYDKEKNSYRLEISYFKSDESEIIKNILLMGSSVVVLEPRGLQKIIYKRIEAASQLYD